MSDMLVNAFDFKVIKEEFKKIMGKYPTVPYELVLVIIAKPPSIESSLVKRFSKEGRIKSYQKKEVCIKINDAIRGALNNHLESSLNRFSKIKNCSTIKVKSDANEFRVLISFRNLIKFSSNLLYAVVNHFNVGVFGYCDQVEIILSVAQTKESPLSLILKEMLPKIDLTKFVTLADKDKVLDFFRCPEVKEILFAHIFPFGLEYGQTCTEITYDALREDTVAQKRRKIMLPTGEIEALHDVISPYTTHSELLKIVDLNNILGFYPSVRTTKTREIVTAIIDIDVSGFLRTAFSQSVVWNLVVALTEEIIKNLTVFLRLPVPLVAYSGSRGVHITYRLAPDCVNSDYNYVNLSELYLLPSQKSLVKNTKSIIHNKFTFIRSLMQAILLYTTQNIPREIIPKAIRDGLGIVNIMDLFTISVFSHNEVGVLMDTSSNNSSVFRIFSVHPTTGLVSIPILDPKTKIIQTKLRNYSSLKEASKPETIIKNFKAGKKDLYFQFPPLITREQIKYLLRPDTLLPYLSVIVRFSDRWVTERSPWSMKYWLEMYKLNNFYDYIASLLLSINRNDKDIGKIYQKIVSIINISSIKTKKYVREVIDEYFFQKSSFNSIKTRLNAWHDLEYYYLFKSDELSLISSEKIELFLSTPFERKRLFKKYTSIFNISLVLLIEISKDKLQIKSNKELALKKLFIRLKLLLREVNLFKDDKKFRDELKTIQIACMYNILIKFFKNLKIILLLYS